MRIDREDNPRHQLVGPISALLIVHKYNDFLQVVLSAPINECILDLLFDSEQCILKNQIINFLGRHNQISALILKEAFAISANFSAQQKMRAFEYMNGMLQVDISLVRVLSPEFRDLPRIYISEIVEWYAQKSTREYLRKLMPISSPRPEIIFGKYNIYNSYEEWSGYVQCYGSFYGYNYSDYQTYSDNGYTSYQGCSCPSYPNGDTYSCYGEQHYGYNPIEENTMLFTDCLHRLLGGPSGICGWKYKPDHCLNDDQVRRIIEHASREFPITNEQLFNFTEWGNYSINGSRTLEQQLQCSMSEVSKSDKSIVRILIG